MLVCCHRAAGEPGRIQTTEDRHSGRRSQGKRPTPHRARPPSRPGADGDSSSSSLSRGPVRRAGRRGEGRNPLQDREVLVVDRLDRVRRMAERVLTSRIQTLGFSPRGVFGWYHQIGARRRRSTHPPPVAKDGGSWKAHQAVQRGRGLPPQDHQRKSEPTRSGVRPTFYLVVAQFEQIGKNDHSSQLTPWVGVGNAGDR